MGGGHSHYAPHWLSRADALIDLAGPLRVEHNIVHVWGFSLETAAIGLERCRGWLSGAERKRASRFVHARDRDEHVIAHGVLRRLLSLYTDMPPEALEFFTGPAGKPSLAQLPVTAQAPSFNLTHSGGRALLAVSDGQGIGIDLEQVRANVEVLSISRRYFFGTEREAIERAPSDRRDEAFFRYWVAKEAVLKACGLGLGFPLDRFQVEFAEDGLAARVVTLDPAILSGDWRVRMLPCGPGWFGAVAARSTEWSLRLRSAL